MNTGSEIDGYLFENHGATSRIIQIFQRPGTAAPQIGKTFVLIHNEGKANEIRQRVTIKTSDPVIRKFTENVDGKTTDYEAQGRQTGDMLVRIIEGADPAGMPVELQETLELVINPDAAEAMGVTIPDAVVKKADKTV